MLHDICIGILIYLLGYIVVGIPATLWLTEVYNNKYDNQMFELFVNDNEEYWRRVEKQHEMIEEFTLFGVHFDKFRYAPLYIAIWPYALYKAVRYGMKIMDDTWAQ